MAPATPNFPVDLDPISSVRTHPQVRQIGERNFFTFLRASSRNLERNKNTIFPLKKKKKDDGYEFIALSSKVRILFEETIKVRKGTVKYNVCYSRI